MPPKNKGSGNQPKPAVEQASAATFQEGGDPVACAISIIDKKVRNLEKRKNKLVTLKENAEAEGRSALDKDQQEAITKIKDVHLQLELVKDLQKQFGSLQADYQKFRKRQQRIERQQAKEAEREAEKKAVSYTIRVQDMLNSFGDEDKENFRTGSDGAVELSEEELSQIDELYKLINPRREENPNYDMEVGVASDHMLLLMEGSSKEVLGTTYKSLHDILEKIELSGYFSQAPQLIPDDEDSEEEADDYKSAEEQVSGEVMTSADPNYKEDVDVPPEVPPEVEAEPPTQYLGEQGGGVNTNESAGIPGGNVAQAAILGTSSISNNIINYMPSAPSPTFPALGTSPVLLTHDDGFSFMHDSELERKQPLPLPTSPLSTSQQITHQAPPSQVQSLPSTVSQNVDYAQYSNRVGVASTAGEMEMMAGSALVNQSVLQPSPIVQGTTDVTTGQPSPSPVQPSYQSTVAMSSSAPPTNNGVGVATTGVGGALYSTVMPGTISSEAPSGFRQHQSQPYYNRGSSQNKSGRGPSQTGGGGNSGGGRRPGGQGGGSKGNYNNNRNGRGMQGGYDGQGQGYVSRGYGGGGGGGGGGYQQQRGGRPNYKTSAGGPRRS